MPDEQKIQKPASAKTKVNLEDIIFKVMPKEFLGKEIAVVKKPVPPPQPKPVPIPKPVPKPKPLPAPKAVSKKRKTPVVLISVGIIVITSLAVGAFFILKSLEEPVEKPVVSEPEEPIEVVPRAPVRGQDTDSDGLTDTEEALYGTDFRNPDSDADTFLDGNEVFHSYDPLGFAPSTLLDTGSVKLYRPADDSYSVTYPSSWTASVKVEGVSFQSTRSSAIGIQEFTKEESVTLATWYDSGPGQDNGADDLMPTTSKQGYSGFVSDDERAVYLDLGDSVFVFTYDLGEDQLINYQQTFQMIVNSFVVQP